MKGVFVTGTDTDVGKTIVSAVLMAALRPHHEVRYWKPIQTGIESDDDTGTVAELAGCGRTEIWAKGYRFEKPVSPHLAASFASKTIELRRTVRFIDRERARGFWINQRARS